MTTTVFSSSVTSDGTDAIFTYAASGDSLIVNAGVTLSSQGYVVFGAAPDDGVGLDDLHASIGGTLAGLGAFYAFGSSVELTVGSTGRLEAVASAVEASYDSSVSNHGVIHSSEGLGVYMDNVTDATVENWGSIYGDYLGVALYDPASVGSATIVNHGTIESRRFSAIDTGLGTTLLTNDGTILANKEAVHINSFDGLAPNTATIHNSGSITSARNYGIFAHSTTVEITNEGTIAGRKGSIYLPSSGADTVTNAGHLDGRAVLGGGGDVYHGENGWVTGAVWGQAGNDLLVGGASADVLSGGSGSDTVTGGAGADTLTGATGADIVSGGAGDDVFRFAATGDATGDTIVATGGALAFAGAGAAGGDRIAVSAIDADLASAGHQPFAFGTSHDVGHLWAVDIGDVTHIRGNVAGDTTAEFDLAVNDGAGVHASDYAGVDFIL